MSTELSQLKQEVADLWTRYRQHQPQPLFGEDEERRKLVELNRTLEGMRRALSERSSTLRLEREAHRRHAARLSPVAKVVGGALGVVAASGVFVLNLPGLASLSTGLSAGHGVAACAACLLLLAVTLSPHSR